MDEREDKEVETQHVGQLEAEERVEHLLALLARMNQAAAIKRFIERYPMGLTNVYKTYLPRAIEKRNRGAQEKISVVLLESYAFYMGQLKDPEVPTKYKFQALKALREMTGADAPTKSESRQEISLLSRYSDAELEEMGKKMGINCKVEGQKIELLPDKPESERNSI